jgi:prepilin-type N-terminal cleavage/methylation domain-containing protein
MTIINTYMRKLLNAFKGVKGFTLIELLVVIGILGILAAALIATIDPFEQLKKGRDTTTRNTTLEYLNALTRYYATHGEFPWNVSTNPCGLPGANETLADIGDCTLILEEDGELKQGFGTSVANSGVAEDIAVRAGSGSDVSLCFAPTARSLKAEDASIYTAACDPNVTNNNCPNADSQDGTCWQLFR